MYTWAQRNLHSVHSRFTKRLKRGTGCSRNIETLFDPQIDILVYAKVFLLIWLGMRISITLF